MKGKWFSFKGEDNTDIHAAKWTIPQTKVKGIVMIMHGMAEHMERYDNFALFLNQAGLAVYGEDHRGHGKTAGSVENCGLFAEKDGWNKVLDDLKVLLSIIQKENPEKPIFIMGHSMGSFFCRDFISRYSDKISGAIISGSGFYPTGLGRLLRNLSKWEVITHKGNVRYLSKFLHNMVYGSNNNAIKNPKTDLDWLTRDEAVVKAYNEDPYCGFVCSAGFYRDFGEGLANIGTKKAFDGVRSDMPILIYSGDKDPVGNMSKGVRKLYKCYKKRGISDLTIGFNEGARHESLNETNRDEVYKIWLDWIMQHIK